MTDRKKNLSRAGAGRPRGARNKTTTCIKKAIMAALNDKEGATAFFIKLKEQEPRTFAMCCLKLLPYEVNHTDKQDNEIRVVIVNTDDKEPLTADSRELPDSNNNHHNQTISTTPATITK